MILKPTQQQQLAASPEHSVWVTANAGTGKTRILTDRVLRLLLEGVPAHKILCITFTKAAANEMKQRINDTLLKWINLPPEELRLHLCALLNKTTIPDELLQRTEQLFTEIIDHPTALQIQTIHSLCQSILRNFPLEAEDIQPQFSLADTVKEKEMLALAQQRLLATLNDTDSLDPQLSQSITYLARHHDRSIFLDCFNTIIYNRDKFLQLINHYKGVIPTIAHLYHLLHVQPSDTPQALTEIFFSDERLPLALLGQLVKELDQCTLSKTDQKKFDILSQWTILPLNEKIKHQQDYFSLFLTSTNTIVKTFFTKDVCKKLTGDPIHQLQKEAERILEHQQQLLNIALVKQTEALIHIGEALLITYKRIQDEQGFIDNNDLIFETKKLLENSDLTPWILFKLDQKIQHLLLDEAQDTSPTQWKIIRALCDDFFTGQGQHSETRSLFVVGDEKQSIYSFQGADPSIFAAYQEFFHNAATQNDASWHNITLAQSFRSSPAVLSFVDKIYQNPNLKNAVSMQAATINHDIIRKDAHGKVALWPLITPEKAEKEKINHWIPATSNQSKHDKDYLAAQNIAQRIAIWFQEEKILHNHQRKIEPRDIMILVQDRKEFIPHLIKALKDRHIPVAGQDRLKLTEHIAIQDMIALGQWLLFPKDDLALATILKSPIIGISEEQLFELAAYRDKKSLWEALALQTQDNDKLYNHFKLLSYLIDLSENKTIFYLYSYLIDVHNIRYAYTQSLGSEVHDPLHEFLNLLQEYEKSPTASLQHFIEWIKYDPIEIKRDTENSNNEIRIMTVHGSKGLQAPIVILPDTVKDNKGVRDTIFWELENDIHYMLWVTGAKESKRVIALKEQKKELLANEKLRLLYVALTRAEDELYISGHADTESKKDTNNQWYGIIEKTIKEIGVEEKDNFSGKTKWIYESNKPTINTKTTEKTNAALKQSSTKNPFSHLLTADLPTIPKIQLNTAAPKNSFTSQQIERGIFIHKMLEILPQIPSREHHAFIVQHAINHNFNTTESLATEITQLLEKKHFSFLFSRQSYPEINLTIKTETGNQRLIIDRLIVHNDEVHILDYKTASHVPHQDNIPSQYKQQLNKYKQAVAPLYPDHNIRCFILWTHNLTLHEV